MNIKEEPREVPYFATVPPEALDLVIESDEEITKRKIRGYCEGIPNTLGLAVITQYIHVEDIFAWLDSEDK